MSALLNPSTREPSVFPLCGPSFTTLSISNAYSMSMTVVTERRSICRLIESLTLNLCDDGAIVSGGTNLIFEPSGRVGYSPFPVIFPYLFIRSLIICTLPNPERSSV